jgi:hypothetical protein
VVAPRPHGGVLGAPNAPHGRDGAITNLQSGGLSQGGFYLWGWEVTLFVLLGLFA